MLLDFSVRNFGPFRDEAVLDMRATTNGEHPGNTVYSNGVKGHVLTSAMIFGPNSSGKSYIIKAVGALMNVIRDAAIDGVPIAQYTPFRLSRECQRSPVEMEIRMIIEDVLYDYSIHFDSKSVVYESLFYYPEGHRTRVFVRDEVSGKRAGLVKDVYVRTSSNSAYLTIASKFNIPICQAVWNWIESIIILSKDYERLVLPSYELLEGNPELRRKMLECLSIADFGIEDYRGDVETVELANVNFNPSLFADAPGPDGKIGFRNLRLFLKHNFDRCDCDEQSLYFPMNIESEGTEQMFSIMGPITDALMNGRTVFIDEFGSMLHPAITRWLVGLFSEEDNPGHGQLIANTHDISLMDIQDVFRRDQIYFTNKDRRDGSAELYSLSDFKGVRKDTDVMKAYLFGRFNAMPKVFTRRVI